jgi:hypothetical protein
MFLAAADVSFEGLDRGRLAGASIDVPRPGSHWNARALPIEGWAVGQTGRVTTVEVACGGRVVRRIAPAVDRPDVAAHLGGAHGALGSGFRTTIDAGALEDDVVEVRAALSSGGVAHIGRLRVRRFWRRGSHPAERDVVSVVIVCFNQAHFLAEAIESALSQTYDRLEVIVVDDGSTDNTAEIVARHPSVRYVHQANGGLPAARNTGIRRSNGEFLVFLDADDRLTRDALRAGIDELAAKPECAFVSGEHCYVGVDGAVTAEWQRPLVTRDHYLALLGGNYIGCPAAVMFRRAAIAVAGGFTTDPDCRGCEDYELSLRIARVFPVSAHAHRVVEYRRYGGGMSDNPAPMLRSALAVLARQRPFARDDGRRAAALAAGRRYWRAYYGGPLAQLARRQLRKAGGRREALRNLSRLLRYAPSQLAAMFRRE